VITEDVPAGALGVARGRQHNSAGWVERRHPGTAPAAAAARARQAAEPAQDEQAQDEQAQDEQAQSKQAQD
jgi:bifunctional UDP-N-acetylglucosamine pyrophosphorylase/glucosamine-1-phosphate N-acetyltransferase